MLSRWPLLMARSKGERPSVSLANGSAPVRAGRGRGREEPHERLAEAMTRAHRLRPSFPPPYPFLGPPSSWGWLSPLTFLRPCLPTHPFPAAPQGERCPCAISPSARESVDLCPAGRGGREGRSEGVSLLHGQEPGGEQAQKRRTYEGRGRQEGG